MFLHDFSTNIYH